MSLELRKQIIGLIKQARKDGARLNSACETVHIDPATYRRWQKDNVVVSDQRAVAKRPTPISKLTQAEKKIILLTCHLPEFQSLPPSQIVPTPVSYTHLTLPTNREV